MPVITCPERRELLDFVLGRLDEDRATSLETHLPSCTACRELLAQLDGATDPLLRELRQGGPADGLSSEPELEQLLANLERLSTPGGNTTADGAPTPSPEASGPGAVLGATACLGRYRIVEKRGQGGMGAVYQAHDPQLNRTVAVKVPRFDPARPDHAAQVQRFLREARSAAQVRHPHVCPVYDAGEQDGAPYVVMAYIEGESLDRRLQAGPLDVAEAVALVAKVARGLEAVHAQGLVHRDLKPANILLERSGEPLLTDFGLARPVTGSEQLTHDGAVVGTPAYMAPEQARNEPGQVGPRTDVYSLGVVLYQLLTGRLPFDGPVMSLLYRITHESPPAPRSVRPDLDPALEEIVMKAMAREPARRYASAAELAKALEAWSPRPQETEPALRRRWPRVLVAAALLGVLVGVGWLAAQVILRLKDKEGNTIAEVKVPGDAKELEIEKDGQKTTVPLVDRPKVIIPPEALPPLMGGEPLSPVALVQRPAKIDGVRSWTIETREPGSVISRCPSFSPDGHWFAAGSSDGTIRIWDAKTGGFIKGLVGHTGGVWAVSWSPDSTHLASVAREDKGCRVWQVESGRLVKVLSTAENPGFVSVAWSGDGGKLVASGWEGPTPVWDVVLGRVICLLKEAAYSNTLGWSPDTDKIVSRTGKGVAGVWDARTGELLRTLDVAMIGAAWSPKRDMIATAHQKGDGSIRLWDATTGKAIRVLKDLDDNGKEGVTWSPDGSLVACGDPSHASVWDATTGNRVNTFDCNSSVPAWAPDGKTLATSTDEGITFWDVRSRERLQTFPVRNTLRPGPEWSKDGAALAILDMRAADTQPTVPIWSVATGQVVLVLEGSSVYRGSDWSSDHQRFAMACLDKIVRIWDAGTGQSIRTEPTPEETHSLRWSPSGERLAAGRDSRIIVIWDSKTGKTLLTCKGPADPGETSIKRIAWSPDETLVAGGCNDNNVYVWETATGKLIKTLPWPGHDASALAWSPDGKTLAWASAADKIDLSLWDPKSGEKIDTFPKQTAVVRSLRWTDAKTLVAISEDRKIRFWDADTIRQVRTIDLPATGAVSENLRWLAAPYDSSVQVYEVETGRPVVRLMHLGDKTLAISPDGHYKGSPRVERHLVYIVETDQGQETLTPDEFARKYGWKNDPDKVKVPAGK